MDVVETVAVFVGIPALIVIVVGGLAYAGSDGIRRGKRYRPGRPYDFAPVWFLAAPEQVTAASDAKQLGAKPQPPALSTGELESDGSQSGPVAVSQGATGGASDRW
ncbi:MAG TPA: hypothetical protein VFR67_19585 [Pilimelia sp.]|nr:hypothetical protein [Pilimelia sp.]